VVRRLLARASASVASRWTGAKKRDRVAALTGIPASDWQRIALAFPDLPTDPGPPAADRREKLHRLASRALATGRWKTRLDREPPGPEPAMYVSAHIGSLQALRYALRARGVPAASVIGRFNLDRTIPARTDPIFDRRFPVDFPHALASTHPHRLRSALKRGSLIVAADMPGRESRTAAILGGRVRLDPRPFRLARAARVECRAAFLTLPPEGWTLMISPPLPDADVDGVDAFARVFAAVASRAPLDLDGMVYRAIAEAAR
jgi:hypothetical protein